MTDAGILELTDLLESLDFATPCEWDTRCDLAAEWVAKFVPCGHEWLACDKHRDAANKLVAESPKVCALCDVGITVIGWVRYER